MAIVQASLVDEILTRQERNVIRGIYRASQLNEARMLLTKIKTELVSTELNKASAPIQPNTSE